MLAGLHSRNLKLRIQCCRIFKLIVMQLLSTVLLGDPGLLLGNTCVYIKFLLKTY